MWRWHDDKQKLRIGNIVNSGAWSIYNGLVGLWIVVLMRLFVITSNAVSIWRDSRSGSLHAATPDRAKTPVRSR